MHPNTLSKRLCGSVAEPVDNHATTADWLSDLAMRAAARDFCYADAYYLSGRAGDECAQTWTYRHVARDWWANAVGFHDKLH